MEKMTSQKLRLGLFVINGLTQFVLTAHYIGEKQKKIEKTKHLQAVFNNVNGLTLGNNEWYSGINVGNMSGIEMINDSTIIIGMFLDKTNFPHL